MADARWRYDDACLGGSVALAIRPQKRVRDEEVAQAASTGLPVGPARSASSRANGEEENEPRKRENVGPLQLNWAAGLRERAAAPGGARYVVSRTPAPAAGEEDSEL
jgi:hypothetical protein